MSNYVYLTCLDHTPPLLADRESGQHLYDLPRIRSEIADRDAVAAGQPYERGSVLVGTHDSAAYFRARSATFLQAHPSCRIGITDENGQDHPVEAPSREDRR